MVRDGFGKVSFPTSASDHEDTLAALDPGRQLLCDLFAAAIRADLGAAWDKIAEGTALNGKSVVEDVFAGRPTRALMRERRPDFPLLCVYRSGAATFDQATLEVERATQPWTCDFVLGALSPEDEQKLGDVFQAVSKVIARVIRRRGHESYKSGALQFFSDTARFGAIRLVRAESGNAVFAGGGVESEQGPTYFMLSCDLETVEHDWENEEAFTTPHEGAAFAFYVERAVIIDAEEKP